VNVRAPQTNLAHGAPLSAVARRFLALTYGAICHVIFVIAALTMVIIMGSGMTLGFGRLAEPWSWVANVTLLLQLPLGHSFFLSDRGRRVLKSFAPKAIASDMAPTVYVIIAAIQVGALFALWTPSGAVWWQAEGALFYVFVALFLASWGLLGLSTLNAGLELQSGFNGWSAVFLGRRVRYPDMPTKGLFRFTRNPIYVSFALTTWTVPIWTPDALLVAIGLTAYCVLGPILKEARYRRLHGERFDRYARNVPYFVPRMTPAPTETPQSGSRR
jgi:protein-S-isoprenylcysteine O-methyltransferase Ste14